MTQAQRVPFADFPPALHDELAERIARYSVGLTRIDRRDHREVPVKSGSGTLITYQGHPYLLTADHVVEDIKKDPLVGLLVDWTGGSRRCVFELTHLDFVRISRGPTAEAGPDLAAIRLPTTSDAMGTLRSLKNFYDLDRRIESFQGEFPALDTGVWLPCGVLAEGSVSLPAERGFATVNGYQGMCGLAVRPQESQHAGFDYLDLIGDPKTSDDMPSTFQGLSGGGLWHGIVGKRDGQLCIADCILSGVIFYEDYLPDGSQLLRTHGRVSIHVRLAAAIRAHRYSDPQAT